MRVMVTGVGGLLGREAARLLAASGHEVFGCDVRDLAAAGVAVEGAQADVALMAEVAAATERGRPEAVLHTAGLVGPVARRRHFAAAHVNIVGTLNVLEAARLSGVRRVVLCSSALVYDYPGAAAGGLRSMAEDGPLGAAEVYGGSKQAAEALVGAYDRNYGIEGVSLRFARIYGPLLAQTEGAAMRELGPVLAAALRGDEVAVKVPSPPRRGEYVYVEDAAAACVAALTSPAARGPYNVGSGELHDLGEFLDVLAELEPAVGRLVRRVPDEEPIIRPSMELPMDQERAARDLGWRPAFPARRGLAELLRRLRVAGG
jgi:nucleoside-diphosphate-sugar epimerase